MRDVDDCLRDLLDARPGKLVEQDRHNNWDREAPQQVIQVQQEGVGNQPLGVIGAEKIDEVFQSDPCAACDALHGLVIAESDLDAVKRQITEHKDKEHGGEQQNIKLPIPFHRLSEPYAKAFLTPAPAFTRFADAAEVFIIVPPFFNSFNFLSQENYT